MLQPCAAKSAAWMGSPCAFNPFPFGNDGPNNSPYFFSRCLASLTVLRERARGDFFLTVRVLMVFARGAVFLVTCRAAVTRWMAFPVGIMNLSQRVAWQYPSIVILARGGSLKSDKSKEPRPRVRGQKREYDLESIPLDLLRALHRELLIHDLNEMLRRVALGNQRAEFARATPALGVAAGVAAHQHVAMHFGKALDDKALVAQQQLTLFQQI